MCRCSAYFFDQQTHASNQPQPIPPLGTLLQVTILFPSEAELAKKELGFWQSSESSSRNSAQSAEMLCIPPPQKQSEQKSGIKNNNSQQHKDDTIPCAQATLTVCDCMKYPRFPRFAQPGQNKVQIHQSVHKLIQFVKDLEIFDHAKLLTNGTLTIHKSSQTWILPKNSFHHASLQHTRCTASFSLPYG